MSGLKYYDYAGPGEHQKKNFGHSQAVRIGDRIECSGQGGWWVENDKMHFSKDIKEEIAKAFENVDAALKAAGGKCWSQVFRVNSYHTNLEQLEKVGGAMSAQIAKWVPNHHPIWTKIGVSQLGLPGMRVEIEVVAYDTEGAK